MSGAPTNGLGDNGIDAAAYHRHAGALAQKFAAKINRQRSS